jgi:hypothetical protein
LIVGIVIVQVYLVLRYLIEASLNLIGF